MSAARASQRPFFKAALHKPEVMGHRGGARQWPGETVFAFHEALKVGVDVIEMDVHSTSDGHLVLSHDSTVDKMTDGRGPVNGQTLVELKKLDAGYTWTADGGKTFPFRGQNIKIPTLEEVFIAFPNQRVNIEIKQVEPEPSIVQPLADIIRKHKLQDKVLMASFSHTELSKFRGICPEVATSASTLELAKFLSVNTLFPGAADAPDADAIQISSRAILHALPVITKNLVRAAHQFGLPIHGWTVNTLKEMQRVTALGVDGIITDFPGPLLRLLGR